VQSFGYFLGGVDADAVCKWRYLKKIVNTRSNARTATQKLTNNSFLTVSSPFSLAFSPRSSLLEIFRRRNDVPSGEGRGDTAVFGGYVFAVTLSLSLIIPRGLWFQVT